MIKISSYVKIIIIIILLKPVISAAIFGNKNEKYVNFVTGLIIITLLITPFTKPQKDIKLDYSHDFEQMNYEEIRKQSVKKQIEERLNTLFKVDDVTVIIDENYNITDVKSREQIRIKEYLGL